MRTARTEGDRKPENSTAHPKFGRVMPDRKVMEGKTGSGMGSAAEDRGGDPDLAELALMYNLSTRAITVCEGADLRRLSDIRSFYMLHLDFRRLRNCGAKTVKELGALLANAASLPGQPPHGGHGQQRRPQMIRTSYRSPSGMACLSGRSTFVRKVA